MHAALPFALLYLPATHKAHVPPFGPLEPVLQIQFAIDIELTSENDRVGHVVQEIEAAPAYVPATHGVQTLDVVAPVTPEYVPAGQVRQNVALLAPVRFEYVPAEQFVLTVAQGAAYFPA